MKAIKKHLLLLITVAIYAATAMLNPTAFKEGIANTLIYLKEMVQILPAVFILTSLLSAWVPREVVEARLGKESGPAGRLISLFLGAVSAGPVYISFPLVLALFEKGMSVGNAVILISAWAAAKVPMFLIETRFLGIEFAALRTGLTVIAILIMGKTMDLLMKKDQIISVKAAEIGGVEEVLPFLPGLNCRACCYDSCLAYAQAVLTEKASPNLCRVAKEELSKRFLEIKEKKRSAQSLG